MARPPKGSAHVDKLAGPPELRERLRVIIESLTGQLTIADACERLDIGESRFNQLRDQALQGALDALVPKPPGPKPAEPLAAQSEMEALQQQVAELRRQLVIAQTRAEIAATMPGLLRRDDDEPPPDTTTDDRADAASDAGTPAKKGAPERPRRRRPKRH